MAYDAYFRFDDSIGDMYIYSQLIKAGKGQLIVQNFILRKRPGRALSQTLTRYTRQAFAYFDAFP